MPNRILSESVCTSETIDRLTPAGEVFFYRLLVQCDDFGRFDGRLSVLRSRCFPLRLTVITDQHVGDWLSELVDAGLVRRYAVADLPYVQVVTWEKWQRQRAKRSKFPEPDDNCRQLTSNDRDLTSHVPARAESESESKSNYGATTAENGKPRATALLAQELAQMHGVTLEPQPTLHAAHRVLLQAAIEHQPEKQQQHAMGVACEFLTTATDTPVSTEVRRHLGRLMKTHPPLFVLDALAEAVKWGAGVGGPHASDPLALTKYATKVLVRREARG